MLPVLSQKRERKREREKEEEEEEKEEGRGKREREREQLPSMDITFSGLSQRRGRLPPLIYNPMLRGKNSPVHPALSPHVHRPFAGSVLSGNRHRMKK